MIPLTVDAILNFLWLGISVSALLWFARSERIRSRHIQWQRMFAVFLATIALFPAVSETDDLLHFSLLKAPAHHHRAATSPQGQHETKGTLHLARLLETLDHFQVTAFYRICVALCFLALLLTLSLDGFSRPVFSSTGRAPPLA